MSERSPEGTPAKALRLYPLPALEVDPAAIYRDLPIILSPDERNAKRPYVILNMVATADGKAAACGTASGIGSGTDRRVMRNLRAGSDAVMVGANTLRAERLSLGLDETQDGPQPLAVVPTATGDLPLQANLVSRASQAVLVLATHETPAPAIERLQGHSEVVRVPSAAGGYPDLAEALRVLKRDYGVWRLLVEGGPGLNGALISGSLVDELFLTVAPKLLGADPKGLQGQGGRTILDGLLPATVSLRLLSVHLAADELFLRYALERPVR